MTPLLPVQTPIGEGRFTMTPGGGSEEWITSLGRRQKKMMEIIAISVILLGMAAKKKPVFGQLTLTGEMALDWMKNGMEVTVAKVAIGPIGFFQDFNVPDWAGEKTGDIALIFLPNEYANPILVTQRSILRALEVWCVQQESKGAKASIEKKFKCQAGVLTIEENHPTLKFSRDEKIKFSTYEITEI